MKKVIFLFWLTLMILVTGGALLIELTVQQSYRQSANDPQIQLAEDWAGVLKNQTVTCQNVSPSVDITTTLAPFIDVYNQNGQAINVCIGGTQTPVTGKFQDRLSQLPSGVFSFARAHGEDRFTWQPASGQRFAAVLTYYHGHQTGFVLAARSLKEVEIREANLGRDVGIAWLVGLIVVSLGSWLAGRQVKEPTTNSTATHF